MSPRGPHKQAIKRAHTALIWDGVLNRTTVGRFKFPQPKINPILIDATRLVSIDEVGLGLIKKISQTCLEKKLLCVVICEKDSQPDVLLNQKENEVVVCYSKAAALDLIKDCPLITSSNEDGDEKSSSPFASI